MSITTNALVLRRQEHRESDLVLTLFTESHGTVGVIAFGARRSKRRFPVLDPFHTMRVEFEDSNRDLLTLREASIAVPRLGYMGNLERMMAASTALAWVRHVSPPRDPDPALWKATVGYLDVGLTCDLADVQPELAAFGLTMLRIAGWSPVGSVQSGMSAASVMSVVTRTMTAHA